MKLAVGDKWTGETVNDGCVFDYDNGGPFIKMFFDRPTEKEIEDVRHGKLQMGYYVRDNAIFIVAKFGHIEWVDMPFNVRRYERLAASELDLSLTFGEKEGLSILIMMVDSHDGTIKVLRQISSSHRFAVGLMKEMVAQTSMPYNDIDFQATVDSVYESLMPEDIAARADVMFRIK